MHNLLQTLRFGFWLCAWFAGIYAIARLSFWFFVDRREQIARKNKKC